MPKLSVEEVARLAQLARIDLQPDEMERLASQLDVIVENVAKVNEVVSEDTPATSHPLPLANVFREDELRPSLSRQDALASAPAAEDGQFRVPQIIGEEP